MGVKSPDAWSLENLGFSSSSASDYLRPWAVLPHWPRETMSSTSREVV